MEQPVFHVVLEGRKVGPYDRRTIVGMRIKNALTSHHVLVDAAGVELTVADLIARRHRADFAPARTGSFSIVLATYAASVLARDVTGLHIPAFKGEVEARIQGDVLRIAGRYRRGFGWKEDRVKIPVRDVAQWRVVGSRVELWLRMDPRASLQLLALELFTPETAAGFVTWFPAATAVPAAAPGAPPIQPAAAGPTGGAGTRTLFWVPAVSVALVVSVVLLVLMYRRF